MESGTLKKEGSMTKLNQILIGVLIAQLVVAALVLLPRTLSSQTEAGALLPDLDAEQAVVLNITSGEGDSLTLSKEDGGWVLASAGGYPTLEGEVGTLLEKVGAVQTNRLVTETPGSHKRLQVAGDEFQRLVEVEMEGGDAYRFYIGSSPSFGATHVRLDGENEVYLTSELSVQDAGARAADWVDTTYVDLPRDEITAMTLQNEHGTFEFAKEGETWTMAGLAEGEILDDGVLQSLLLRATNVTLQQPLGTDEEASYGLDVPQAVVTLETAGETHTLRVGGQDPEDSSYVLGWSGSPFYARVSAFSVKDFVEKTRDDLLQQPTPEPEATPAG
jgi:hypothetical protein